MATRFVALPLERITDFQVVTDPVTGATQREFGTCGPTSVAAALTSALGHAVALQDTYAYERTHGLCDQSGASTLSAGVACAKGMGASVAESSGYVAGWPDWLNFLRRQAGINPVVVETSVGQVLVDSISGQGENATNLQYHFFAVLGYHAGGVVDAGPYAGRTLPEGVFAADGACYAGGNSRANNFNAANQLQFYSMTNLAAAKLCGGFALVGRTNMLTLAQTGSYFVANADGSWHCPATNRTVKDAILGYYRNVIGMGSAYGLSDLGLPISDETPFGAPANGIQPTIQVFERGGLAYDPDRTMDSPPGATGMVYKVHLSRPEVLAALGAVRTPIAAPILQLGPATINSTGSDISVSIPYTLK